MIIETLLFLISNVFVQGVIFHSLLVTRCKIPSLLVTEVARCKNSLVTHCKKPLVTRCKIRSLLVAENAHSKNSLVVKNHSLVIQSLLIA